MEKMVGDLRRVLAVDGACNVRDLGGYLTNDGRTTRWGTMLRAASLHQLAAASQQELIDGGLRTVIDLRGSNEIALKPNVFSADSRVNYHNISIMNPAVIASLQSRSLGELYISLLDHAHDELRHVFALLAEASEKGEAALFHCAAGKDRTGVIAALLLALAGVPNETIVEDYTLTAECLLPMMDELRSERPDGVSVEVYEQVLGCDAVHMERMLAHLESRYGNAERFLQQIGLSDEQISAIRTRLSDAQGGAVA